MEQLLKANRPQRAKRYKLGGSNHIVDIIIPVFNQAGFVRVAIDSLLSAHNRTEIEIVVIDDKSEEPDTLELLATYQKSGSITLLRNEANQGFTRTVNRGMALHPGRDVVLLNSDTKVHGDWLDRLRCGAQESENVATVNPITSQFGSHISCYPRLDEKYSDNLEIGAEELAAICRRVNSGKSVSVHQTVGFCMYIRRAAINMIGVFDQINFPVGYGEESDFCYRATKVGWQHKVVGDAYVEHFEGKSFGTRKRDLMAGMTQKFSKLHPDLAERDLDFIRRDPLLQLRRNIDIERLRLLLNGAQEVELISDAAVPKHSITLVFNCDQKTVHFDHSLPENALPNIKQMKLPQDIALVNQTLLVLNIKRLVFSDAATLNKFKNLVAGHNYEMKLVAELKLKSSTAFEVKNIND